MVSKLNKELIAKNWDEIAPSIEVSLPPTTNTSDRRMLNILQSSLEGRMQVWVMRDDDTEELQAVLTTTIMLDTVSEAPYLLIYTLYGYDKPIPNKALTEGFKVLEEFAKQNYCRQISAFSMNPAVDLIARKYNANPTTYYSFPIK